MPKAMKATSKPCASHMEIARKALLDAATGPPARAPALAMTAMKAMKGKDKKAVTPAPAMKAMKSMKATGVCSKGVFSKGTVAM